MLDNKNIIRGRLLFALIIDNSPGFEGRKYYGDNY